MRIPSLPNDNRILMVLIPERDDYWKLAENITDPMTINRSFLSKYHLADFSQNSMSGGIAYKETWKFDLKLDKKIFQEKEF